MLEATDIWFRYGRRGPWCLRGASLLVRPGEVVALEGASGRGKTTLARILGGLLVPSRGKVVIDGHPLPPRGHMNSAQLVFQSPQSAFDPRWRLRESLEEAGPTPVGLLDELAIDNAWLNRFPHELSGGELQRLALARALTPRPRLLIADEITAMLDPISQASIWQAILRRCRTEDLMVVAVSHDVALVNRIATRRISIDALSSFDLRYRETP